MKKITLDKFIARDDGISERLKKAVIVQIGGWTDFKRSAGDISRYGMEGGYNGFIYYSDTEEFAKKNMKEIIALAKNMDKDLYNVGLISFISCFGGLCGKYDDLEIAEALIDKDSEQYHVLNALAWFAAEEVARSYDDAVSA